MHAFKACHLCHWLFHSCWLVHPHKHVFLSMLEKLCAIQLAPWNVHVRKNRLLLGGSDELKISKTVGGKGRCTVGKCQECEQGGEKDAEFHNSFHFCLTHVTVLPKSPPHLGCTFYVKNVSKNNLIGNSPLTWMQPSQAPPTAINHYHISNINYCSLLPRFAWAKYCKKNSGRCLDSPHNVVRNNVNVTLM